tara:strand:+ start:486 stop:686 length:201 start_codon:yes stop_codon:yes gene_type:complete
MDENGSLYVRGICMACGNKTYSCPYCNGEGKVYVEASDKSVSRWLAGLTKERRDDIIEMILDEGNS